MTLTVKPMSYTITVVGGSFAYGMYQVVDPTGVLSTAAYPGHFVLNATGAAVNPATDDTQLLVLAQLEAIAAKAIVLTDAFGNPTGTGTDIFGNPIT